jgi:hypothetical protein
MKTKIILIILFVVSGVWLVTRSTQEGVRAVNAVFQSRPVKAALDTVASTSSMLGGSSIASTNEMATTKSAENAYEPPSDLPTIDTLATRFSGAGDKQLRVWLAESEGRVRDRGFVGRANHAVLTTPETREFLTELRTQAAIRNVLAQRILSEKI